MNCADCGEPLAPPAYHRHTFPGCIAALKAKLAEARVGTVADFCGRVTSLERELAVAREECQTAVDVVKEATRERIAAEDLAEAYARLEGEAKRDLAIAREQVTTRDEIASALAADLADARERERVQSEDGRRQEERAIAAEDRAAVQEADLAAAREALAAVEKDRECVMLAHERERKTWDNVAQRAVRAVRGEKAAEDRAAKAERLASALQADKSALGAALNLVKARVARLEEALRRQPGLHVLPHQIQPDGTCPGCIRESALAPAAGKETP